MQLDGTNKRKECSQDIVPTHPCRRCFCDSEGFVLGCKRINMPYCWLQDGRRKGEHEAPCTDAHIISLKPCVLCYCNNDGVILRCDNDGCKPNITQPNKDDQEIVCPTDLIKPYRPCHQCFCNTEGHVLRCVAHECEDKNINLRPAMMSYHHPFLQKWSPPSNEGDGNVKPSDGLDAPIDLALGNPPVRESGMDSTTPDLSVGITVEKVSGSTNVHHSGENEIENNSESPDESYDNEDNTSPTASLPNQEKATEFTSFDKGVSDDINPTTVPEPNFNGPQSENPENIQMESDNEDASSRFSDLRYRANKLKSDDKLRRATVNIAENHVKSLSSHETGSADSRTEKQVEDPQFGTSTSEPSDESSSSKISSYMIRDYNNNNGINSKESTFEPSPTTLSTVNSLRSNNNDTGSSILKMENHEGVDVPSHTAKIYRSMSSSDASTNQLSPEQNVDTPIHTLSDGSHNFTSRNAGKENVNVDYNIPPKKTLPGQPQNSEMESEDGECSEEINELLEAPQNPTAELITSSPSNEDHSSLTGWKINAMTKFRIPFREPLVQQSENPSLSLISSSVIHENYSPTTVSNLSGRNKITESDPRLTQPEDVNVLTPSVNSASSTNMFTSNKNTPEIDACSNKLQSVTTSSESVFTESKLANTLPDDVSGTRKSLRGPNIFRTKLEAMTSNLLPHHQDSPSNARIVSRDPLFTDQQSPCVLRGPGSGQEKCVCDSDGNVVSCVDPSYSLARKGLQPIGDDVESRSYKNRFPIARHTVCPKRITPNPECNVCYCDEYSNIVICNWRCHAKPFDWSRIDQLVSCPKSKIPNPECQVCLCNQMGNIVNCSWTCRVPPGLFPNSDHLFPCPKSKIPNPECQVCLCNQKGNVVNCSWTCRVPTSLLANSDQLFPCPKSKIPNPECQVCLCNQKGNIVNCSWTCRAPPGKFANSGGLTICPKIKTPNSECQVCQCDDLGNIVSCNSICHEEPSRPAASGGLTTCPKSKTPNSECQVCQCDEKGSIVSCNWICPEQPLLAANAAGLTPCPKSKTPNSECQVCQCDDKGHIVSCNWICEEQPSTSSISDTNSKCSLSKDPNSKCELCECDDAGNVISCIWICHGNEPAHQDISSYSRCPEEKTPKCTICYCDHEGNRFTCIGTCGQAKARYNDQLLQDNEM